MGAMIGIIVLLVGGMIGLLGLMVAFTDRRAGMKTVAFGVCLGTIGLVVIVATVDPAPPGVTPTAASAPVPEVKERAAAQAQPATPAPETFARTLDLVVSFSGTQFKIANTGGYAIDDVTADLNGGTFRAGYVLKIGSLRAGETATVGAMQFANSAGVRFNPFQMKAQRLTITAANPDGTTAMWMGGWE